MFQRSPGYTAVSMSETQQGVQPIMTEEYIRNSEKHHRKMIVNRIADDVRALGGSDWSHRFAKIPL